ncbi:MAG: reverse transcriptase family protein [Pseudomonadota bacterium]
MEEKDLWKAVNQHTGKKSSSAIMSLMARYESPSIAVNAINSHLKDIFVPCDKTSMGVAPNNNFDWSPNVSSENICHILSHLHPHKSSPDIPNVLYRSAATFLAPKLSKLFQMSLSSAVVPKIWKSSVITPIPKTRVPCVEDIRPISLISPIAKTFEKIILNSLKPTLLSAYGSNQFGFRPKSSTLCALTRLHNRVTDLLDNASIFGVIIIAYDYSKAFDRLRTDLIIKRLTEENFPSKAVLWIANYLSERSQTVKVGLTESCPVEVTSGVPQGSILGPYLYSVTTATYKPLNCSDCEVFKYADDTTLVFPLHKSSRNDHIQREHQHLLNWSMINDLKLNVKKCKAMIIRKPNVQAGLIYIPNDVVETLQLNLLGVIFNSKCTWSSHIDHVIKKCSRLLFAFRKIRSYFSSHKLRRLYFSLVRTVIEYCAPLYVGISSSDALRLSRLQSRFHRVICGPHCDFNCLPPLELRRSQLTKYFLLKIMDADHILHRELPEISRTGRFILPPRRTDRRSKSFFLFSCEKYNADFVRSHD